MSTEVLDEPSLSDSTVSSLLNSFKTAMIIM